MALNYQSDFPSSDFMKLENGIENVLEPEALKLYIVMRKLTPFENNSNDALMKKSNLSQRKFIKAKNELLDKGFIETRQVKGNRYLYFIGKERVEKYRASKLFKPNRHDKNN